MLSVPCCPVQSLIVSLSALLLCAVCGLQGLHYNSNRQTVGIVYVTREASSTDAGFTLMITFVTNQGDLPLLVADVSAVTPLTTATAVVTEFIKGFANSFTVEPRKANGELVKVGTVVTRMPPPHPNPAPIYTDPHCLYA